MKRKSLIPAAILMAVALTASASAHSGRTDKSGGHWDSETGEYHYHHGYPAHYHEDLDGDGIPDCPYEFDNKTGQSSGTSSGSSGTSTDYTEPSNSSYNIGYRAGYEEAEGEYKAQIRENEKTIQSLNATVADLKKQASSQSGGSSLPSILTTIAVSAPSGAAIAAVFLHKRKSEEIDSLKRNHKSNLEYEKRQSKLLQEKRDAQAEEEKQKLREEISRKEEEVLALQNRMGIGPISGAEKYIIRKCPAELEKINPPEGVYLTEAGIPIMGTPSNEKPYGEYTAYLSESGTKYHAKCGCSGAFHPVHAFDVIGFRPQCSRCVRSSRLPKEIPSWYISLEKIKQKFALEDWENNSGNSKP